MTSTENSTALRGIHSSATRALIEEAEAMAQHALAAGKRLPSSAIGTLESLPQLSELPVGSEQRAAELRTLALLHHRLARIVAPATPRTIVMLACERRRGSFWRFVGPVPLIRRMMLVALVSLACFVATALSKQVDATTITRGVLNSSGDVLLLNLLFLLSAAGLGAGFSALFQANRYVGQGTYDSNYESSYWARLVLGLIAGLMLAELLPLSSGADPAASNVALGKPTLAMLGGFSAAVVYRILVRLVQAVESIVKGDAREVAAASTARELANHERDQTRRNARAAVQLAALHGRIGNQLGEQDDERMRAIIALLAAEEDTSTPTEASAAAPPSMRLQERESGSALKSHAVR